jgi:hypothetical protein
VARVEVVVTDGPVIGVGLGFVNWEQRFDGGPRYSGGFAAFETLDKNLEAQIPLLTMAIAYSYYRSEE